MPPHVATFPGPVLVIEVWKAQNSLKATSWPCQPGGASPSPFSLSDSSYQRREHKWWGQWTGLSFPLSFYTEAPPCPLKTIKSNKQHSSVRRNQVCMQFLNPPENTNTSYVWFWMRSPSPSSSFLSFLFLFLKVTKEESWQWHPICPQFLLCVLSTHPKNFSRENRMQISTTTILCFVAEVWLRTCSFRNRRWMKKWGNERQALLQPQSRMPSSVSENHFSSIASWGLKAQVLLLLLDSVLVKIRGKYSCWLQWRQALVWLVWMSTVPIQADWLPENCTSKGLGSITEAAGERHTY